MLELHTKDLDSRKQAKIDGHVYTIRPAGAGDDMKLNVVLAKIKANAEKVTRKKVETAKDIAEVAELQAEAIRVVSARYDDGGDGSKAFELISTLSPVDRYKIEEQVFDLVPLESIASLKTLEKVEETKKAE